MSNKGIIIFAVVGALITAVGLSTLFIRFATETYTLALKTGGGGIEAAAELQRLHKKADRTGGLRGFLARSIYANGGLVYTKHKECDIPCEGIGCKWEVCGMLLIYAEDFSHISYKNGIARIPLPKFSLWVYTIIIGVIIGVGVASEKGWVKFLSIVAILGMLVWPLATILSPTNTTILLSGAIGGILALIVVAFNEETDHHSDMNWFAVGLLATYAIVWVAIVYYNTRPVEECPPVCIKASLSGADLHEVHWSGVNLFGADLTEANLEKADLRNADLRNANLSRASLIKANLEGANLEGASLDKANLAGVNLSVARLHGANLSGANLGGANLTRAFLNKTNLSRVNLSGANLQRVNMQEINLEGVNLKGANLRGAGLWRTNLRGAIIDDTTRIPDEVRLVWEIVNQGTVERDLSGAYLLDADLSGVDLSGVDLSGAELSGADLNKANLSQANLKGVDLIHANLKAANLEGAILEGADLRGAKYNSITKWPANFDPKQVGAVHED